MCTLIQTNEELVKFCNRLKEFTFVTIDTEFIREKTYWPCLCLIQLASTKEAFCIDPLAEGIDLSPVFELMQNPDVTKVFHAARQDLEIFYHLTGNVPVNIFDTQVAAMVCGFGESVSYQTLVSKLAEKEIDKGMRFTDWSCRPLSDKQVTYALSDVTYLRIVYQRLLEALEKSGRHNWFKQEIKTLSDPKTYENDPCESWKRIKQTSNSPQFLGVLQAISAWRENEAKRLDRPRKHIIRDEQLLEIAASMPESIEDMSKLRALPEGFAQGRLGNALLNLIRETKQKNDYPQVPVRANLPRGTRSLTKLLKMLLMIKAEQGNVAEKLIASSDDIDLLASQETPEIQALSGWRYEMFGKQALALKDGKLAVCYNPQKKRIEFIDISKDVSS